MSKERSEYGDWQTPYSLAKQVCRTLEEKGIAPTVLFEPTCGKGTFIKAALETFTSIKTVYAVEIYKPYVESVQEMAKDYPEVDFHIHHQSIFDFDFTEIKGDNLLVLGNPPWVTNSELGSKDSDNLPPKSNFKKCKGLDAMTGKGNFDIAEYILTSMFQQLHERNGHFALLVKNSVIKNIVLEKSTADLHIGEFAQYEFNALKEFGASTSASLFYGRLSVEEPEALCKAYNFYTGEYLKTFGLHQDLQIADIDNYKQSSFVDGASPFVWRSGIKHDCSKVMELSKVSVDSYVNGFKEPVSIEPDLIYPLLKSSDIAKYQGEVRKYLIVTQKHTSDDTSTIKATCPSTYQYLEDHAEYLDNRKSKIYKKRPRFCLFGIGDYSFEPYKIVISALYKITHFSLVSPIQKKNVMIDDTCYSIGFNDEETAKITLQLLNSSLVQNFIRSISFPDAKRVITKDILMRIDLKTVIEHFSYKDLGIDREAYARYKQNLLKAEQEASITNTAPEGSLKDLPVLSA